MDEIRSDDGFLAWTKELTEDDLLESPYFFFGTVDDIVEHARMCHERFGFASWSLLGRTTTDLAPLPGADGAMRFARLDRATERAPLPLPSAPPGRMDWPRDLGATPELERELRLAQTKRSTELARYASLEPTLSAPPAKSRARQERGLSREQASLSRINLAFIRHGIQRIVVQLCLLQGTQTVVHPGVDVHHPGLLFHQRNRRQEPLALQAVLVEFLGHDIGGGYQRHPPGEQCFHKAC